MQSPPRTLEGILADVGSGVLTVEQAAAEIRAGLASKRSRRSPFVVFVTLTLIGVVFLSIGAAFGIYSYIKGSNTERTEGEVTQLVASGGKGGKRPVVRYSVDGQPFEITGFMSTNPPAYTVGEKVTIIYDRDRPAEGTIDAFVERWLFAVIFGGVGVLLLVIGSIIALALQTSRRRIQAQNVSEVGATIGS